MAESGYYEPYPAVDGSSGMLPGMAIYRQAQGQQQGYGGATGEKNVAGPGFYAENGPFSPALPGDGSGQGLIVCTTSSGQAGLDSMAMAHSPTDYPAMPTATTHLPGMYEGAYSAIKAEARHMPPTPPGSPEEGLGGELAAQNLLAKPVPMRRLSEKRIAQARATLTSSMLPTDPMLTPQAFGSSSAIAHALSISSQTQRRPRSEKKAIPEESKDDKYFERRKRNNLAAKKSRDARKAREDEIAIRASFLEKENAILRAQVATLREEANSLRQLLLQKRSRP